MIHQSPITSHRSLSVVYATKNEEDNLGRSLDSIKEIASEIIVFDEYSKDRTREIAKEYGARLYQYKHKTNFHETKQKAIDKAKGIWILQLDADEVVTPELADEIEAVISGNHSEYVSESIDKSEQERKKKLFLRHQKLIEDREGKLGKEDDETIAYFIPRLNMFLGKEIRYGGVYPDGVIRLFKKGKARLPGISVHELMEVDGRVGWLFNPLMHYDSPTLERYIKRAGRYTDIKADELSRALVSKLSLVKFLNFVLVKPVVTFAMLFFRHKGFMDNWRGFLWALFSSAHHPVSYLKFLTGYRSLIIEK